MVFIPDVEESVLLTGVVLRTLVNPETKVDIVQIVRLYKEV